VGTVAVEEILRAREEGGHFKDLEDFFKRVNTRIVNRKALESLIKSGAFDRYGERSFLLHNLDMLLAYASRLQKELASGQTDLFGNLIEGDSVTIKVQLTLDKPTNVYGNHEQLVWERELLGLYLSQHPLQAFETFLNEHTVPLNTLKAEHDGRSVTVGGAIQDFREITTKNGQKMAFVKIEDQSHEVELILFPSMYQQTLGIWERDRIVLIKGKVNAKDRDGNLIQDVKVMVDDAREITPEQATAYQATGKKPKTPKRGRGTAAAVVAKKPVSVTPPRVYIRVEKSDDHPTLTALRETIDSNKGDTEVVLVVGPSATKQVIRLPMRVSSEKESLEKFGKLVGVDNVKFH
jgi:DNA polymerase III alpha subunit